MEAQIHSLEQEAYASVLRAFKAQSDAITWEKEGLITELRKELRVSDDEHREILINVNNDETIRRIREWRQLGGHQGAMLGTSQSIHDLLPSPTVSMSRKKQKTSQSVPHLSVMPNAKPMQFGSGPATSRSFNNRSAVFAANVSAEADQLTGKKVWTRWPDDNFFYEAVITDYNALEGRHALVYDINTPNETWEWVDLKEISPEDIRWDEDPSSISNRRIRGGPGTKRTLDRSGSVRVRAPPIKSQPPRRETFPSQNGVAKKLSQPQPQPQPQPDPHPDDIELFNTDSLVNEVQKVFDATNPNPVEIAKAKKMLKEHELALVEAISRLGDAYDDGGGESDGEHALVDGQPMEQQ